MLLRFINLSKIHDIILLLSILIALIPFTAISPYISQYVNFVFILMILSSILLHIKKIFLPVWILNIISVILIIMPFLFSSLDDILLPSIESLVLILSIRFLSKKSAREYFQICLLSLLLLGSSSLFNFSWIFGLRIILMLIFTIFTILLITYTKETKEDSINFEQFLILMKLAIFISIATIPLSIFFFIILPRVPFPLMDIGYTKTKTGFSSTVNLGSIRDIEEDKTIVMRVKVDRLPETELYWRVITFDFFNGKDWQKKLLRTDKVNIYGEKIDYTIILEPLTEQYLPTLDYPFNVFLKNVSYEYPGIYKIGFPFGKTIKYSATSFINYKIYDDEPSMIYTTIPSNISKELIRLTEEITSQASNKSEIIDRILKFLSNYEYSLKDLPRGENPIEDFLFKKKRGNCEYFATTMALMLRIKGIPSRVVGGFKGGTYNSLGGYYIIRASDAHLWVEAWVDKKWLRFDPSGKIFRETEPVIFHFIDYLWNSIVLDYDIKAQFNLAKSIKIPTIKFNVKILLILLLLLVVISISFKTFFYIKEKRKPLNRFFSIMKKYGFERKRYQGLEEFVSTIDDSNTRQKAERFIKEYQEIYFKDKKIDKQTLKKLNLILKQLDESR